MTSPRQVRVDQAQPLFGAKSSQETVHGFAGILADGNSQDTHRDLPSVVGATQVEHIPPSVEESARALTALKTGNGYFKTGEFALADGQCSQAISVLCPLQVTCRQDEENADADMRAKNRLSNTDRQLVAEALYYRALCALCSLASAGNPLSLAVNNLIYALWLTPGLTAAKELLTDCFQYTSYTLLQELLKSCLRGRRAVIAAQISTLLEEREKPRRPNIDFRKLLKEATKPLPGRGCPRAEELSCWQQSLACYGVVLSAAVDDLAISNTGDILAEALYGRARCLLEIDSMARFSAPSELVERALAALTTTIRLNPKLEVARLLRTTCTSRLACQLSREEGELIITMTSSTARESAACPT